MPARACTAPPPTHTHKHKMLVCIPYWFSPPCHFCWEQHLLDVDTDNCHRGNHDTLPHQPLIGHNHQGGANLLFDVTEIQYNWEVWRSVSQSEGVPRMFPWLLERVSSCVWGTVAKWWDMNWLRGRSRPKGQATPVARITASPLAWQLLFETWAVHTHPPLALAHFYCSPHQCSKCAPSFHVWDKTRHNLSLRFTSEEFYVLLFHLILLGPKFLPFIWWHQALKSNVATIISWKKTLL